jgi:murein L,D-transpeptidase YcbB/YkuD
LPVDTRPDWIDIESRRREHPSAGVAVRPEAGLGVRKVVSSRPLLLSLTVGLALLGWDPAARAQSAAEGQRRLETAIASTPLAEPAAEGKALRDFYRARQDQPAWSGGNAAIAATLLRDAAALAAAHGLDPATYALPATPAGDMDGDVQVSATLLRLGRDLSIGAVLPARNVGGFGAETRRDFDGAKFLKALAEGRPLAELAGAASPQYVGYARLMEGLEKARAQAAGGGWPTVPDGPKLTPGETGDRVPAVRRRLAASGELDPAFAGGDTYDGPLVEAVKRFQIRHGLEPDGVIGGRTLAHLNVPADARVRQIVANLERWRWMPRSFGRHHIAVNIAAAQLEVVEDGAVIMAMRVVVGDIRHPTPSMNTTMSSVVLNPAWRVPSSIANKEILPKLRKDPNYLANSNLEIVDQPETGAGSAGDGVDWNAIGKKFPYRLRQPPGPDNALGQLKFNLTDSDDIYMHDTPNRRAFGRNYRALSHGCVRLERPVELGELLLGPRWQGKLGDNITANRSTRTLLLERTMPVYLMYWTAWADDQGNVQFRDDLYGHDRRLITALERARAPLARPVPGRTAGAS